MAIQKTMLVAEQAGKTVLLGVMTGQEIVAALRGLHIQVNPDAQRSLMKGANKETSAELLASDRIEATPRMKSFLKFADRLMELLEKGENQEGFLGAIQLVIPEAFTGARITFATPEMAKGGAFEVQSVLRALGSARLGVFEASPGFNEAFLHLGDGQGRGYLLHSMDAVAKKEIVKQQKLIRKLEKAHEPVEAAKVELARLEERQRKVQAFLTKLHLGVMIYADSVDAEGRVKGLSMNAEKRLYIEGNALNSQASQEEILKYEQYSPVILALRDLREGFNWMGDDFIESESKTVSSSSQKIFTLSALVQAFSYSIINNNQPLKKVESDVIEQVGQHRDFVEVYWEKITEIFKDIWVPEHIEKPSERIDYLESMRGQGKRNVLFQAIFLLALGRLGYEMGVAADWDPESPILEKVYLLSPKTNQYDAEQVVIENGARVSKWAERWTNTMMKPSMKDGALVGYVFNNSRENIEATFRELANIAEFTPLAGKAASTPIPSEVLEEA